METSAEQEQEKMDNFATQQKDKVMLYDWCRCTGYFRASYCAYVRTRSILKN